MARRESVLCEQRPNSRSIFSWLRQRILKWELQNNSRQIRNLTKNAQSDSLNKSQPTLSNGFDEGGVVVDEDDEWEQIKLITGPHDNDSGYWQNFSWKSVEIGQPCQLKKEFSSLYTRHVMGGGGGKGQSMPTHIRSQLGFTPPSRLFMHLKGFMEHTEYNMIISWLGKTNNANFLFSWWNTSKKFTRGFPHWKTKQQSLSSSCYQVKYKIYN